MKTYLKHYSLNHIDIVNAFNEWTKSASGHKNKELVNVLYGSADNLIDTIYYEITNRSLSFKPIRHYTRIEPTNGKKRDIGVQEIKQQVCDYLVVKTLSQFYEDKIGYYQCASIPKKGQVFACKHLTKWYRDNKSQYFVKLDIKKCYPSMDKEVVFNIYKKYVGNADILYVIYCLLMTYSSGLNIGSYFSQYSANLIISFIYHKVESLNYNQKIINHQLWYMDDAVLFSWDKKLLRQSIMQIEEYINQILHLTLKPWKIMKIGNDWLDMCGYVISSKFRKLRKFTFKKARRTFKRIKKKIFIKRARRAVSYYGFLKWCSSNMKNIVKPLVDMAKSYISFYDKEKQYV